MTPDKGGDELNNTYTIEPQHLDGEDELNVNINYPWHNFIAISQIDWCV